MLVFQARPVLSVDLSRPLPHPLVFRPERRPVYPVDAATQPHLLLRRAHGLTPSPATKFQGAMQAPGACAWSSAPLSQGTGACTLSATPPATGARSSRATPLSRGTMPVTGACASSAAPLSRGTGDRALSATPPAMGAYASSAAPLSYGIIQATGASASGAAPLSLGTGARASSAAVTSHSQTRAAY